MVFRISSAVIFLGIFMCNVTAADVNSANNRCLDLIFTCFKKFRQFENNRLCRELRNAINCLNTTDAITCGFPAVTHKPEENSSQSNHFLQRGQEIYQSDEDMLADSEINQSDEDMIEDNGSSQTKDYQSGSGFHSEHDGSRDYNQKPSEDSNIEYITSLIEVIEDAREEYKRNCSSISDGNKASHMIPTSLIGWILTCNIVCKFILVLTTE